MQTQAEMEITTHGMTFLARLGITLLALGWYLLVRRVVAKEFDHPNGPRDLDFWFCTFFSLVFTAVSMGLVVLVLFGLYWVVTGK